EVLRFTSIPKSKYPSGTAASIGTIAPSPSATNTVAEPSASKKTLVTTISAVGDCGAMLQVTPVPVIFINADILEYSSSPISTVGEIASDSPNPSAKPLKCCDPIAGFSSETVQFPYWA